MARRVLGVAPLLLLSCVRRCESSSDDAFSVRFDYLQSFSNDLSDEISDLFGSFQDTAQGDETCVGYDMMADQLKNYACDTDFGDSAGCECSGRPVGEILLRALTSLMMINLYSLLGMNGTHTSPPFRQEPGDDLRFARCHLCG